MKSYREIVETGAVVSNCCNNCGKRGHNFHQCKLPIISNGIIAFRINPAGQKEYLMIRRRDTLGFIDFVRGKYSVNNPYYISNMICQMTLKEKEMLLKCEFDELLRCVWGDKCNLNGSEECAARDKFAQLRQGVCVRHNREYNKNVSNSDSSKDAMHPTLLQSSKDAVESNRRLLHVYPPSVDIYPTLPKEVSKDALEHLPSADISSVDIYPTLPKDTPVRKSEKYTLQDLVYMDKTHWEEPEWGFPKGRRDNNESDLECALREFCEETGYKDAGENKNTGKIIENVLPFEETFIGSNYKSYKHKYYLMKMDYAYSKNVSVENIENNCEISAIRWMSFLECVNAIRAYNLEKRKIIICVNTILTKYVCL